MICITKAASSGLTWMAVEDEFDNDPGIIEERQDRAGIAVSEWPHGVEDVGCPCSASIDGGLCRGVVSGGVTDRRQAVVGDHHPDRFHGAWQFGRDGRHSDRATGRGKQSGHDIGDGVGEQVRGMRTFEAVRQPWALEVDAGQVPGSDVFGEDGDLPVKDRHGRCDQGGDHGGSARGTVGGQGRLDICGVFGSERGAAPAVAVDVDITGDKCPGQGLVGRARRCALPNRRDYVTRDLDPTRHKVWVGG
jgi:hypothetical protein